MLLSRRNQMLLEFSFWNEPQPRAGPNIYELRTYKLKVPPLLGPQLPPASPAAELLSRYPEVDRPCAPAPRLQLLAFSILAQYRGVYACVHTGTPRCESGPLNEAKQPLELGRHDSFPS